MKRLRRCLQMVGSQRVATNASRHSRLCRLPSWAWVKGRPTEIVRRALAAGLVECPLELAPYLRLKYRDQPDSADGKSLTHGRAPPGSLLVASSPLDASYETPKGFYLRHVDRVLWLRGYWSSPDHTLSPGDVLVFSKANAA